MLAAIVRPLSLVAFVSCPCPLLPLPVAVVVVGSALPSQPALVAVAGSSCHCRNATGGPPPLRSCPNSCNATCSLACNPLSIGRGTMNDRYHCHRHRCCRGQHRHSFAHCLCCAGNHTPVATVEGVDRPPRGLLLTSIVLTLPQS